ncbi:hypothetical protein AMTRI_Chr02g255060 [Amborella trichopoda]|nr:GPI mannosyltransferase 1 isoform X1 [Amborella trichopoda]XP_020523925.1 GPI mannosyltransferase 1 isoform X1 [Amborella trichopoda]XP_020523926.1 GPI mannosyltransferase 1 isoform X1 [Amborella trichopoda]XP_020523927.1 GPI mannosyltransferase 1 isoform X1 [Amborella trichopoda]XP_020523928.1 GPI mannosyltransferase 1 isoform X1 [Amborella trichopoda]|eukprot:XP_011624008.1 GPI mannosyltransferase 1 isoform X1 [Amborella trichopoda]
MTSMSMCFLMGSSALVRLFLILYGQWQDTHMEVRYTDIDYIVFSDAASLMASNSSPFGRTTYRYSPLLAFLLIPNSFLHPLWGKFIFSVADLLVGYLLYSILKMRAVPERLCLYSVVAWLFNPFTFTIGTRGNCEPIVCAMILWIIMCLMNGNLKQAAFWYGLVVHFRIYPIIYSLSIVLTLDAHNFRANQKPLLHSWSYDNKPNISEKSPTRETISLWNAYRNLVTDRCVRIRQMITKERIIFGLFSCTVFCFWTGLFYYLYGWEFLNEALLYHLTRTDPRHNFSIYFYDIYLRHEHGFSLVERLLSFLPQLMVQPFLVFSFAGDLPFCLFLQTVAFVAFNKVITAQYFVWFFCLLPLILPWTTMKLRWTGLLCICLWVAAQIHWLMWGYLLEFKGMNVFIELWLASIFFLAANTWVMVVIMKHHKFLPLFVDSKSTAEKKID